MSEDRIAPVDGLRAVAVLGVVWAHVWAFSGTPSFSIGRIGAVDLDLNRAISVIGSGVDLFFVISGFCMYLMYARRQAAFSWSSYLGFLKRRWLRIAPAFYVAALVAASGFVVAGLSFPTFDLAAHFAFLHIVLPGAGLLAAPFWSLSTEWHFYMVLPFILWGASRWSFWHTVGIGIAACIAFRIWIYAGLPEVEAFWKIQLPSRLVEFMWGLCVARFYAEDRNLPRLLQAGAGFLIGVLTVYAGRFLMVTEVVTAAGTYGYVCKALAEPLMTAGYALILWNVTSSRSWFRDLLSLPAFTAVGRWSYSLYLWHWWPTVWISSEFARVFGSGPVVQHLSLTLCLGLLLPLSWFSYRVLELPYFQTRQRFPLMAGIASPRLNRE